MTRTEHLLVILMEECAEVAQRASKALRFGLEEVQPGQPKSNVDRVADEMTDLVAVYHMLLNCGAIPQRFGPEREIAAKQAKVETYLRFSAGRGLVDGTPADPTTKHPEEA